MIPLWAWVLVGMGVACVGLVVVMVQLWKICEEGDPCNGKKPGPPS